MGEPEAHIAAWEAAGLIDAATAARLHAAVGVADDSVAGGAERAQGWSTESARQTSGAASAFGPGVSIGEMFGYLGGGFLLSGWIALTTRADSSSGGSTFGSATGLLIAAVALVGLAAWLRTGSDRSRRGAGVGLLVATGLIGAGVGLLMPASSDQTNHLPLIAGGLAAVIAGVAFRAWSPGIVTHLGALYAATFLASALLAWVSDTLVPPPAFGVGLDSGAPPSGGIDPMVLVVGEAAWWSAIAIVFGLIGLREARSGTPAAARRAAASRAWAGLTAVVGITAAVVRSANDPGFQRVLEPWIGDVAILVTCAFLVERAFRRETSVYIYPAALGLIIAATDINASYLSDSFQVGLLVEGAILLGVGVLADRLRRRIGTRFSTPGPVTTIG